MAVTTTRAREDRTLADVSRRHNVEGLVADEILTKTMVKKDTGLIGKYGNEHLRIVHSLVGGLTEYPRITVDTKDTDRYVLEKHGLSVTVTEEEKDNEIKPYDALNDATIDVTERLKLGREFALSSVLTDTAVLTNNTTLSGTDQWSDYTASNPLENIRAARASVYAATGKDLRQKGGFALLPWDVENYLSMHPDLLELYKYTGSVGNGLTLDQLRQALKVDRIILAMSQYDSSKEGQTPVITPTWGKHVIFGFAPKTGSKKITTMGFNVSKTSSVRVFRDRITNPPNAEEIKVDITYDDLITDVGAAYLIKDAVA
jgi:hypothetical protein